MREFVNAANVLTTSSLVAGVAALMLVGDGQLGWSLAAVGVAALLDSVDGWVARRTGVSGPFGTHLDGLADLTAFGVAPALMLHHGVLGSVAVLGAGACFAFVVAGAWRLSRFPLLEDREHFIGLPIPPAGLILAAVAVLSPPAAVAVVLCVVLSLLMIGAFTVPTLAELGRLVRRPRTNTLIVVHGDRVPVRVLVTRRGDAAQEHQTSAAERVRV